jgi:dienelactone hydrolase
MYLRIFTWKSMIPGQGFIVFKIDFYDVSKESRTGISRPRNIRYILVSLSTLIIIVALVMTAACVSKTNDGTPQPAWSLDGSNALSFSQRELIDPRAFVIEDTTNYSLERISYDSYNTTIYGLLRIPKNVSKPPIVIVLPAATVTKEADSPMASALASWGYASLTLDERGNGGETRGISPMDFTTGYNVYRSGGTPVQYAQIYDVLLGYDYLRSRIDLDGDNIAVLGESMGGRFAIIAAGIEPGFKGAFVVSSSSYGLDAGNNSDALRFVDSIEPATYLKKLPPRKLVMFHFTNDTIIPIAYGRSLYDSASQPKAWYQYNGSVHGVYSDIFAPDLHAELKSVFQR